MYYILLTVATLLWFCGSRCNYNSEPGVSFLEVMDGFSELGVHFPCEKNVPFHLSFIFSVHPTGFPFCLLPGFLAIFILLSSNNNMSLSLLSEGVVL